MYMKRSDDNAQIGLNIKQLIHLCICDANARACLVTPLHYDTTQGGSPWGCGQITTTRQASAKSELKMWVKSNPTGAEDGVTPLRHILAQPTREIGEIPQPGPCRLNYFAEMRGTNG